MKFDRVVVSQKSLDITADNLINNLLGIFEILPGPRTGKNCQFQFSDFVRSVFSTFLMQFLSFLNHQRCLEEAHNRHACQSLLGTSRFPTDNYIREKFDHKDCQLLNSAFDNALGEFTGMMA